MSSTHCGCKKEDCHHCKHCRHDSCKCRETKIVDGNLLVKCDLTAEGTIFSQHLNNTLPLGNHFTGSVHVNDSYANYGLVVIGNPTVIPVIFDAVFVLANLGKTLHFALVKTSQMTSQMFSVTLMTPYAIVNNASLTTFSIPSLGPTGAPFSFNIHLISTSAGPYVEVSESRSDLNP